MDILICSTCGWSVDSGSPFCRNCGAPSKNFSVHHFPELYGMPPIVPCGKPKIPGRGFGITSMVLGIIGLVYALIFSLLITVEITESSYSYYTYYNPAEEYLPALIIIAVMPLLAVIFGGVSKKRGYRCGVSTAGISTGIVGLCAVSAAIFFAIAHL